MRAFWRAVGRVFFWSYERMTWQYDVMVALIVAFVLLTPRQWFHDQPRPAVSVQLVSRDAVNRIATYRLEASSLGANRQTSATKTEIIQRRAHDVLRDSVSELKGTSFQVVRVDPKLASDGSIAYYDVTVQR
jgi:hypothetical protein